MKFCWGGKAAEKWHYPMRTLMIDALHEKDHYVAYERGDRERPWAFLIKVDEGSEEWATAVAISETAKEVDSEYIELCRAKCGYTLMSI